ncbi:DUF1620 super [Podochytrium sp. JEL0797]|nr:DUF1620 super [Podochytrium sp. JEL0797]
MVRANWATALLVLGLAQPAFGIFKDQIGQLDWLKSHTGIPSSVSFSRSQAGASLAVASLAGNTVAVVSPATGSIVWRHQLAANDKLVLAERVGADVLVVLSSTSDSLFHVRAFDASTGFAVFSWSLSSECKHQNCSGQNAAVALAQKTKDLFVLLPTGKVARFNLDDQSKVWASKEVNKDSTFTALEVSENELRILGTNRNGNVNVQVLAIADGSVLSTVVPEIAPTPAGCFFANHNAVVCNAEEGVAAFAVGSNILNWVSAEKLFDYPVAPLSIAPLSPSEFIISSGPYEALVKVTSDAKVALVQHFAHLLDSQTSVFSATEGPKRNAFVARVVTSDAESSLELFNVEAGQMAGVFALEHDVVEQGNLVSIHLDAVLKSSLPSIRVLAVFQDGTVSLLQQQSKKSTQKNLLTTKWTRDESLAHIVDSVFVELPDGSRFSLESDELREPLKESQQMDPVSRFFKRLVTHSAELQNFFTALPSSLSTFFTTLPSRLSTTTTTSTTTTNSSSPLHADRLGFRQLLIVATTTGKLHALDTEFGRTVWTRWMPNVTVKDLEVLRTGVVAFPAVVGVFGVDNSGDHFVHRVNALTGADYATGAVDAVVSLGVAVDRVVLVPAREEGDGMNVYVVMDSENQIRLYPDTVESVNAFESVIDTFYYYRVVVGDTLVQGFMVEKNGDQYLGKSLWTLTLPPGELIASFAAKDRHEPISSLGRVLGNRSVLYKYLNPNLLALATIRATHATSTLYVYLLDTVTGSILHRGVYAGAGNAAGLESVYLCLVDNSLLVSYFNHGPEMVEGDESVGASAGKRRRGGEGVVVEKKGKGASPNVKGYEITVLEMYEMPKLDARVESDTYTSFNVQKPSVLQQTYVFPHQMTAMGVTRTGAGIASREILFGLSSQQLYGVNKRMFDPRRPYGAPTSDDKEEQLFPYHPVVNFNPTDMASHVLEVAGITTIVSTSTNLESTSIVAAYGLDLFVTRRAPSKTFDLLSEDFGYVSLVVTLVALGAGIWVAKYYAENKRVYDQWK